MKKAFAPLARLEFPQRFKFVVHSVAIMSSEVETSLDAPSRRDLEIPDFARNDKDSFQFRQLRLDLIEIGQLPGVIVALRILDHTAFIDNECRPLWDTGHSEFHLRQE